ncbi:MAG: helix-turn-helix transcriptional regulator [Actinomycetota bacterium]|nr:helix-turn-helix transcriptional regulator [Actinomycetota bacterium]
MKPWEPGGWPGRPSEPNSLARRIAALRVERGWTQQDLAERLGVSRVAVSHLETDINSAGERTVALLAGLFRMEPHELVDGTSYPVAKADRLPVVVARWTEVEHQLALLDRDLRWLESAERSIARRVLAEWHQTLESLAARSHDPSEQRLVAEARRAISRERRL